MNFLTLISNKIFQRAVIVIISLGFIYFAYLKIETILSNNIILRKNNQELQTLNQNLKLNLKEQKEYYEEQLKATQFKTTFKEKKEVLQKEIDTYKKPNIKKGVKSENSKNIDYDAVINFAL